MKELGIWVGESIILAFVVALLKVAVEFGLGTATEVSWDALKHAFLIDGLIVGFLLGAGDVLRRKMVNLQQNIKIFEQHAVDKVSRAVETKSGEAITNIRNEYKNITNKIRETLRQSNIYVAGVCKQDGDIVHLLGRSASRFRDTPDGVLILKRSGIKEYSDVCLERLTHARKSIWSMSDMGLDQTFMLYCQENTGLSEWDDSGSKVRSWINEVNKASKRHLDVKRIQVVNADRMALIEALTEFEASTINQQDAEKVPNVVRPSLRTDKGAPIPRATHFLNGWKRYVDLYVNGLDIEKWYAYNESDTHQRNERGFAGCTIGEFIIFDEMYLVRYSSQTGVLEVLVGKVVEVFAKQFKDETLLTGFNPRNRENINPIAKQMARLC